jgi:hypothetical protein
VTLRPRRSPFRLHLRVALTGLVALTLGACADLFGSDFPTFARYTPPAIYQIWWDELERCSGENGNMGAVTFLRAEGVSVWNVGGVQVNGLYQHVLNQIVVADDRVLDGRLVRHEMLHALTGGNGHTYDQFVRRCGDYVTCPSSCIADAGSPDSPPLVFDGALADSLAVSVRISPKQPSRSAYDGRAVVIVEVRNPFPFAVAVPATTAERIRLRLTIDSVGNDVSRGFPDGRWRYIGAGETRRMLFDLSWGPSSFPIVGPPPEPVEYQLRATYATRWADSLSFVLAP